MKHTIFRRALGLVTACALLPVSLPASLVLPSGAEATVRATEAPAYTASADYPGPAADVHINGKATGAMQVRETDVIGMQIVLTAPALSVSATVPSYSNNTGSATMALFRFDTDYDTSLLSEPIAEHTFVDFKDSADLTFRFSESDPLPAGEYILLLYDMKDPTPGEGNGTGIGLWTYTAHEGQRTYFNGSFVSDRTHPVKVNYVTPPSALYGIPQKPIVSGDVDYAPLMRAVLDFRTPDTLSSLGGNNSTKAAHMTEGADSFVRFTADVNAGDPYQYIHLPDTVIKCTEYRYLLLKVRRAEGSDLGLQVFFSTDEVGISEPASVRPTYENTTDWQYLVVNLGASGSYAGLLKTLRLDYYLTVAGTSGRHVDLQYMALFKSEEAARAFRDNFEDFSSPVDPDDPSPPVETDPDYSDYLPSDPPSKPVDGKLTENGQLSYIYRQNTYTMDFSATIDEYMASGGYSFTSVENAMIHNEVLQCKAFSSYTFYTSEVLGDKYGIRGGTLEMDLSLTAGTAAITVRRIKPLDDLSLSGLCFTLAADGQLTVADRDGFSDRRDLSIDFSVPRHVAVTDAGDTITLSVDGTTVYTLLWDNTAKTLRTPDGEPHTSIHLPGAGYAAYRATRTRGYVDNVRYTYTDIVPKTVSAARPVDFSTWSATDDLDRTTPTDVGPANDKQVGLFYFLIHSDDLSGRYVNDVTRFYLEGGADHVSAKLSSMIGVNGAYWAEPYFGYYSSHDEWVYRKHAYMLSAAGVDFIFLDVSNNVFYIEQATVLFDTWKSIRDEGGTTPQIAFMYGDMPFTLLNGLHTLLEPFYHNPDYRDLLYCVDGKPLLLGNSDTPDGRTWTVSTASTPQSRVEYRNKLKADPILTEFYKSQYKTLLSDFTVRKCWAWQADKHAGYWDWLQESPQAIGTSPDGKAEQISVSMGVHAHTGRGRSYVNGDNTYNPGGKFGFTLGTAKYGYFFAEQFEYALRQDVDTIMITGWNEWYAGIHRAPSADQTCGQTPTPNYYMIDQMSPEYSRDGEPMKLRDGEGFGDNYYYQMAAYIRRFKGNALPATVNGGNMVDADDSAWEAVTPAFTDTVGDTDLRHALSFAAEFLYTNGTARNDLDTARVSQDETRIYFRISTATPLITVDDTEWMNLYIDADGDPSTGWEGFDYILNRARTDKTVTVERFIGNTWETVSCGEATYEIGEDHMTIAVAKSLLGIDTGKVASLNFKWADNARVDGDIMRFMTEGDTAPNDRFVFTYIGSSMEDERKTESETTDTTDTTNDGIDTEQSDTAAPVDTAPVSTEPETSGTSKKKGCASITTMSGSLLSILISALVCMVLTKQGRQSDPADIPPRN